VDTLEERLTALERKVNRYRNTSVLLLVVLAGVVLVGATTDDGIQDVIRTKALHVVNKAGQDVLTAFADDRGDAVFTSGLQEVDLLKIVRSERSSLRLPSSAINCRCTHCSLASRKGAPGVSISAVTSSGRAIMGSWSRGSSLNQRRSAKAFLPSR